ncbi:hypothetical protein X801_07842 [Opisthorchis viverrini]|uniref:Uncharacterized protein n=1 Tax=Opisthorchis viverrini TaxID=6198 RepID=A0A1S8WPM5_OPIVI|nr:hypothetical protein X801_07842 [Opisthorchis viverrini]
MRKKHVNKAAVTFISGATFILFGFGLLIFGAVSWGLLHIPGLTLRRRQLLQCFYRPSNDQSSTDRPTNRVTQTLSEDATLVDIKGDHPLDPQTEVTLSRLTVPGAEGVSLKGSRHDGPLQFRPDPNKKSFAKQLSVVPSIIHPSQTTTDVQVHPRPPRGMEVSFSIGGGDSVLSRASTPNERNSQGTLNEDV